MPSLAGAGWSTPVTVSGAGSSTSQVDIAGSTEATSWVVWKRDVGGFDVIQGTRVTPEGTQGPIVTISSPSEDATDPVVASRADGSSLVAWLNLSGVAPAVQTASIAADGTVGPVQTRSAVGPAGQPADNIAIAVGGDGTAGVTWRKFDGANWVIQAVKIAADGTSGTIHDVSDPAVSAAPSDISAAPPTVEGAGYAYRVIWTQGAAATSDVGTRLINPDDTMDTITLLVTGQGGDPFDAQVAHGVDGSTVVAWIRYREDQAIVGPPGMEVAIPYFNWAVEYILASPGAAPIGLVRAATPTVYGTTYDTSALEANGVFDGQPVMAWVHDLNGGGQRVETGRFMSNETFQIWANTQTEALAIEDPSIAANASAQAIAGGTDEGALPGQTTASWTRFSDNSLESTVPSNGFLYSDDPGYAMGDDGRTVAAFNGIDGGNVGSVKIMTFSDPGIQLDPGTFNFGKTDIGIARQGVITIRSTGQTTNEVTGISLSGPDASRYALVSPENCIRKMNPGTVCTIQVNFTPGSTATQTAKVTVTSLAGNVEANLTGSGLNQTRNRISATPRSKAVRKGKVVRIKVTASNRGGVTSNNTRICVNLRKRALKLAGNRCRSLGNLPVGVNRTLNYRVRVTWRAQRGVNLPVTFVMRSNNSVVRQAVVQVRRKGN
ncbi:MAG: choice-of-anchor D domain-containing protein [Solirubrobacterales bacterium]|nr:choice-of-anchor D domain-containing protein [Solirubrobacterales bacterium]